MWGGLWKGSVLLAETVVLHDKVLTDCLQNDSLTFTNLKKTNLFNKA
jgi:hypothetical protein